MSKASDEAEESFRVRMVNAQVTPGSRSRGSTFREFYGVASEANIRLTEYVVERMVRRSEEADMVVVMAEW